MPRVSKPTLLLIGTIVAAMGYSFYPRITCLWLSAPDCVDKTIVAYDYQSNIEPDDRDRFVALLLKAGYDEIANELLVSRGKLDSCFSLSTWVIDDETARVMSAATTDATAQTLAEIDARLKWLAASCEVGKQRYELNPASFYRRLAADLSHEGAMAQEPSRTLFAAVVEKSHEASIQLEDPGRSHELIDLADAYLALGEKAQAWAVLKSAKVSRYNVESYTATLDRLGRHAEASTIRHDLMVAYDAYLGDAGADVERGNFEAALMALKAAFRGMMEELQGNQWAYAGLNHRLDKARLLAYEAGDKEFAIEIAEGAYAANRKTGFVESESWSRKFREMGQWKRAKEIMQPFVSDAENSCGILSSGNSSSYAVEFYHLGMLETAARKISEICGTRASIGMWALFNGVEPDSTWTDENSRNWAWQEILFDATSKGRDVNAIEAHIRGRKIGSLNARLAEFFFADKQLEKAETYLVKAIDEGSPLGCKGAEIAKLLGRDDLLPVIFTKSIESIDNTAESELWRVRGYLRMAGCYRHL